MRIALVNIVLSAVLITICAAADVSGQEVLDRKVTLNIKNKSVKEVLTAIEENAEVRFTYTNKVIKGTKKVSLNVVNTEVREVLDKLFQSKILYEVIGGQIVLMPSGPAQDLPGHTIDNAVPVRTVSGRITDGTATPIPGVNVIEKGTTNGTSSDADGRYSIGLTGENAVLVFSAIGFITQEVVVNNRSVIDVTLAEDVRSLEEVVVVGYGTQRKSDVMSSVSTVNVDKATSVASTNVSEMLRGQATGVQITLADPRPGGLSTILIRGTNSIQGGNDPLIVLDGYPIADINDVSPDDIVSIEILKDAAAQAIYGARASNGVILITTRRGKEGRMNVTYHGYTSVSKLTKNFDLYSPEEFAQLRREAQRTTFGGGTDYLDDSAIFTDFELDVLQSGKFVDWEDLVLRDARINSHTVGVSGGTENTRLYSSITYFDQQGLIPSSGYKRGSFRLNLDQKVSDKFSLETNLNLLVDKQDIESSSLDFITISPLAKPYDEDNNLVKFPLGPNSLTVNPLWNIRESTNDLKTNSFFLNVAGKYNIADGLSYKLLTMINRSAVDHGIYLTRLHSQGVIPQGVATVANSLREEYLIENILTYDKQINQDHHIDLTAVQSVNRINDSKTTTTGTTFANDLLGYDGITEAINKNASREESQRSIVSLLGRIRYSLFDKYLITVTGRYDGSSVFAESKKYGFFPAFAVAWKLHNERFLSNAAALDELKLRLSYGSVGNQALAPYSTLGSVSSFPYIFNRTTTAGNIPSGVLPNPNLTWETSTTFNAGFDFGFLNNRLSGSIEYYKTKTTDLLVDVTLSGITGFSSTITNGGESENSGLELLVTGDIVRSNDLKWSVTTTFTRNRNKILKTGIVDEEQNPKDDVARRRFVGQPINVIYEKKFDGIFQTQEEIDASAQKNQAGIIPGSVRVVDKNNDGEITDDDNYAFAMDPKWFGSVSTSVAYKQFELFADLYVVQGATRSNNYLAQYEAGGSLQGILNGIKVPYWTPENPSSMYPRPSATTPSYLYSIAVQDASYVRLRALSLAYNIPASLLARLKITGFKVYAMANNLFTMTDYKSYSPEINPNSFPDAKSYTIGVRMSL